MKNIILVLAIALALGTAGHLSAEISEPDHILYGHASLQGVPVDTGTLTLTVGEDPTILASYELGSDPTLGSLFALRVALDTVGQRRAGRARTGDPAQIFLDGQLAAITTIGERGTAQLLNADPEQLSTSALVIDDAEILEGANGVREMKFTISLSLVSDLDVDVQWATRSGQLPDGAQSGVDFRNAAGLVTIPAGDSSATLVVEVFGDTESESDEEFFIELSNAQNAVLLDPEGRGVILDDDTPPALSIDNVTATEPVAGESTTVRFTVRLSHVWHQAVTFGFSARDISGQATGGSDYLLNPGSGTIVAGDLSTTIAVEILGDSIDEDDETFLVRLENPENATLLDAEGQGTIADFARFLVWVETQANGAAGVDGLAGAFDLAVSPDGRHVYAAGRAQDSLVVFARDAASGRLTFIERLVDGVAGVDGLAGVEAVLVSRDGTQVFTAGFDADAVTVFTRDADTGALTLLEVERDGAIDNETGRTIEGLAGATALAEAGGEEGQDRHLYVAGHDDQAVAVFTIGADSRLRYQMAAVDGAGDVDGLRQVSDLLVSPDGAHVYAAGFGDHSVVVFSRNETDGFLSFLEQQRNGLAGVLGLRGTIALAMPSSGSHLYAAGQLDSAIVAFTRNTDAASPAFGRLSFQQMLDDGDPGLEGLAAVSDVASSRDPAFGDYLYTSSLQGDAVVVFGRSADGTLNLLESRRDGTGGVDGLDGANALAVSGDDRNVYVAGSLESSVAVFSRDLQPPELPTVLESTSHTPGVPSNQRSLAFRWSGALDEGLGVAEYRLLLDTQPDTEPPFGPSALIQAHGEDPQEAVIEVPEDHDGYFLHLQACDLARNCSANALHLGPFHIDTVAPPSPADVVTLSHGVLSPDPRIEMAWTPPADAGPGESPSALAGYAFSFSLSPEPECDGELDLSDAAASSTISPPLPAGDWYFYICTGDLAGNFSPPITVGPLVVDDDSSPPRVLRIETVASSSGAELLASTETKVAITQLIAVFSEVLDDAGGGTDLNDATHPSNYRLLSAGADSNLETSSCIGGLVGDDREVAIDEVRFDALTGRTALFLNGGNSLALGSYRLLICSGLRDLNGNALDGDGDGVAGGDFQHPFAVTQQNLLRNPNFDRELDGWGLSAEPPVGRSTVDGENATTSGSLIMQRRTGDELTYVLVQCVNLRSGDLGPPYNLSGLVQLTEINGLESQVFARVELHDQPSCSNPLAGQPLTSEPVIGDDSGAWRELTLEITDLPVEVVSAEVSFHVEIPDNFDFDARLDRLLLLANDQRSPKAPVLTSSSHQVGVWSNDPTLDARWEGARDEGVGVKEYHVAFDSQAATFPSNSAVIPHGDAVHTVTSEPLSDGAQFVHLRTCDGKENCVISLLGPFPIDTAAPAPPSGPELSVINGNVLELTWIPPVDPASGLAAYAYAADASPTWDCDRVMRAEGESTQVQMPVSSGTWFMHICAMDAAGNWSLAAHAGPVEIEEVDAPRVSRFDTVSSPFGRDLAEGDAIDVAVTQLVVEFSKAMANPGGDSAAEDVTNPSNYRLLTPGGDREFSSTNCDASEGDDIVLQLEEVLYDETSRTAALQTGDGTSLSAGRYRLLVCGSSGLADLNGNRLGDGLDARLDFEVLLDNLLHNPNFDLDLEGWTFSEDGRIHMGTDDADRAFSSGSAQATLADDGAALAQCVELADENVLEFRSRVRIDRPGASAVAELIWFSGPGCKGAELASKSSVPVIGTTQGAWLPLELQDSRPDGGASAMLSLMGRPSGDEEGTVLDFDNTSLCSAALFIHGFESGSLAGWSSVKP